MIRVEEIKHLLVQVQLRSFSAEQPKKQIVAFRLTTSNYKEKETNVVQLSSS